MDDPEVHFDYMEAGPLDSEEEDLNGIDDEDEDEDEMEEADQHGITTLQHTSTLLAGLSNFGTNVAHAGAAPKDDASLSEDEELGDVGEGMGEGDFEDQLQSLARRKGKKKNKLSPKLSRLMGEANLFYAEREYSKAVGILLEIIRQAPNVADPYHTLGLIYEDMGDRKKALEFYMIAAHLTPKDAPLWKRLAVMSREEGNLQQAIYCYSKAIRIDTQDLDALWDRSVIFAETGKWKKAIKGFSTLRDLTNFDPDVSKELARLYHQIGQTPQAIEVLSSSLDKWKERQLAGATEEMDLDMVNMLAELYMGSDEYQKAILLIEDTSKRLTTQPLPLDLTVNYGICQAYMGNIVIAERQFEKLMDKNVNTYGDLFYDVGETFMKLGEMAKAAQVFEKLGANEQYNVPTVWLLKGQCYRAAKNPQLAISAYKEVLRVEPDNVDAVLALSELYRETGNIEEAIAIVSNRSFPEERQGELAEAERAAREKEKEAEMMKEENIRIITHKGLLHHELNQHKEFLDTALPLILASTASGRNTSQLYRKRESARRRAAQEREFGKEPEKTKSPKKKKTRKKQTEQPEDSVQAENLLQFGIRRKKKKEKEKSEDAQEEEKTESQEESKEAEEITATRESKGKQLQIDDDDLEADPTWLPQIEDEEGGLEVEEAEEEDESGGKKERRVIDALVEALGIDQYFDLIIKTCKSLVSTHQHPEAANIIKDLLSCKYIDQAKREQLQSLYIGIAFDHGDFEAAYEGIRLKCTQYPNSNRIWNLFNTTMNRMGRFNSTSNRSFLVRQLLRNPNNVPLMILAGHHCIMSGTHKFALGEYFRAYHLSPNQAMISLCIGLTYLHQVMNRRLPERHYMVCQAFTWLYQYYHLREGETSNDFSSTSASVGSSSISSSSSSQANAQEAAYNLGRAFHQLGLVHLAVPCYEKALSYGPPENYPNASQYDLKREAAYNLALIYKASGSHQLAVQVIRKHCVI